MTGPRTLCSDGTAGPDPSGLLHAACNRPCLLAYVAVALQMRLPVRTENAPATSMNRIQNLGGKPRHSNIRRLPYALHRPTCTVPAGRFARFSRQVSISGKSMEYVARPLDYNHRLNDVK
jgi:hypothetical protein